MLKLLLFTKLFKLQKQKMALLSRTEEASIQLQCHYEEFSVPYHLKGLAATNIQAARLTDGVQDVQFIAGEYGEPCLIKIFAKDYDAAKKVRRMLEFGEHCFMVPSNMVAKVIGKGGESIQEIVDKSGVLKVKIHDDGDQQPQQDDEDTKVPFVFIGTRVAVDNAVFFFEPHLKRLSEMEEKCQNRFSGDNLPPGQNNSSRGAVSAETWRERRGLRRSRGTRVYIRGAAGGMRGRAAVDFYDRCHVLEVRKQIDEDRTVQTDFFDHDLEQKLFDMIAFDAKLLNLVNQQMPDCMEKILILTVSPEAVEYYQMYDINTAFAIREDSRNIGTQTANRPHLQLKNELFENDVVFDALFEENEGLILELSL